ncbi:MAG: Hint domain-containing protein [Roseicyclus sp.]|nr:Hint domain-containing protein [Roseicyclus sp.]
MRYAYFPEQFAGPLPDDPLAVAQTVVQIPTRLSQHARPVPMKIDGDRLAAPLEIGGRAFDAGVRVLPLWTLADVRRGLRLTAYRLEPEMREDESVRDAPLMVITSTLPLKQGQELALSLDLPEGGEAILRAGALAAGTRILTERGKRPVEDIAPGERVWTEAGQFRPVLWHGVQRLPARGLAAPLRLPRDLLGLTEDILVPATQYLRIEKAGAEALVPASVFERTGRAGREFGGAVSWHQLLLPEHALIHAAGMAVASLLAPDLSGDRPKDWPEADVTHDAPVLPRLTEDAALGWIG